MCNCTSEGARRANPKSPTKFSIEIPRCAIAHLRSGSSSHPGMTETLTYKLFVGDDLDAEAGQSLVVVHRRRQMTDRGDAEIAQDLRADADLAPLPVAVGFRGFLLRKRCDRYAGSAIAQVHQHTSAGLPEMF